MAEVRRPWWAGWKRRDTIFWVAIVGFALTMNWPMLKGVYYRVSGSEAASAIEWRTDLASALAQARATRRPVLVEFGAAWCPPCAAMKHDVWPDRAVARLVSESYVAVNVDVDHDPAGVADRYAVSAIPAVLVLDAEGRVLERSDGYLPVDGLLQFLQAGQARRTTS